MDTQKIIRLGVAAAMVYAGWKGYGKKAVVNTALIAIGSTALVRNVPVVNQYV